MNFILEWRDDLRVVRVRYAERLRLVGDDSPYLGIGRVFRRSPPREAEGPIPCAPAQGYEEET